MLGRTWSVVLLLGMSTLALAVNPPLPTLRFGVFEQREREISRKLIRATQFVGVAHVNVHSTCQEVQPPQALATPNPLFAPSGEGNKVKVSFIIGTDGRVHSPLILESVGLAGDRCVLQTVRSWRYRPATCNGVPTETEGKIEFSVR